jgi:hypothetical protein
MKLSKTQSEVIKLMQEGWELGRFRSGSSYWVQKDGLGNDGKTRSVSQKTVLSLLNGHIIISMIPRELGMVKFTLTEFGKNIL